jgi:hypothetical protein
LKEQDEKYIFYEGRLITRVSHAFKEDKLFFFISGLVNKTIKKSTYNWYYDKVNREMFSFHDACAERSWRSKEELFRLSRGAVVDDAIAKGHLETIKHTKFYKNHIDNEKQRERRRRLAKEEKNCEK